MKRLLKILGIILGTFILLIGIGIAVLRYEFDYKKTEIVKTSEESYTLTMYQVGEPGWLFGSVKGRFVLRKDGKKCNTFSFAVANDGGSLSAGNVFIKWEEDCVRLRVNGEEQEDMLYTLGFDGSCHSEKAGPWYTDEEVISMVKDLYGTQTDFLRKDGSVYHFRAQVSQPQDGIFDFAVEQDKDLLVDNYENAYFKYLSELYFEKYSLYAEWQESGMGAETLYSPTFILPSDNDREIMSFCERFCDYVEYCIGVEPFGGKTQYFQMFSMTIARINFTFRPSFTVEEYERTKLYNELYVRIDEVLHVPQEGSGDGNIVTSEEMEITQEMVDYYITLEPSCSFLTDKGMEYRMIPVDRALGSSFYVLIGTEDGGKTCTFINPDPYNGSGGESRWIAFLDEDRGFSCLAHAAGAYGSLYRTEDGGVSWEEIDYPSAKAKLPDGSYYNPFVMPEKVYEENGMLFLEAGQGADGDYYDDELGYCHGLYQSEDGGRNWSFVRNIARNSDNRYRLVP